MSEGINPVSEQGTESVPQYRKRVNRLAAIYVGIVLCAVAANALILTHGKLFVTLSQRSNVETLTLAVILLLFTYLAVFSAAGAWGALKILWFRIPAWIGRDRDSVERRKQAALKPSPGKHASAFLNVRVQRRGAPNQPVEVPLRDDAGSLGTVLIDGAELRHRQEVRHGSNSLFAYLARRIQMLISEREPETDVQIVHWKTIDDEPALRYDSLVRFSMNLERHLGCPPLWPAVELTDADVETLEREARELCPTLRDEAHLPDMEYQAEHRLPIIPEPLAFVSLSRQEQRADPETSMGCALLVAVVILAIVALFILIPPWLPSK